MPASVEILLIEDNLAEARLLQEFLQMANKQFNLVHVQRLKAALEQLQAHCFDIILLDLTLPDSQGLASLAPLNKIAPSLPIVVLTNTNDEDLAIEAVRQGAQDYLVKRQVNTDVLVRSLLYAIERKQASEALRAANEALQVQFQARGEELAKAQEANQVTSEFVSMLSHDFRNPLTTILLSTGLLELSGNKLTQETKLTHFQPIRSAIANMNNLLEEVLLIGKADTGKLQYNLSFISIEQFCQQLVREFELSISDRHQLVFNSVGEFPEQLWDESLLRHILANLLSNAIKYSPAGGLIKFEVTSQETAVIFQIQDAGIGIPVEYQQSLFQPFTRAESTDSIPGTGLGLAIVKRCVEAYKGLITVNSEIGIGTTFTVVLPLPETPA